MVKPKARSNEMGTSSIPPRPLMKARVMESKPTIDAFGNREYKDGHIHPKYAANNVEDALNTFRDRQETYGSNDIVHAQVMKVLFPNGVQCVTEQDHRMFLMVTHAVGKLTRFTSSGMKHRDSAHDLINYAGFMELPADQHDIKVL